MRMSFIGIALTVAVAFGSAAALDVPLTVANPEASAKTAEPVTSGVPFGEGVLADAGAVRLLQGGVEIPSQFRVTARWPDGSVRWLLCDFQTDLPAGGSTGVVLRTGQAPSPVAGIVVDNQAATLTVTTGAAVVTFDKTRLDLRGHRFLATYGGNVYTGTPASTAGWIVEESGPMKAVIRVDGVWRRGAGILRDNLIGFRARFTVHRNKSDVRAALTFRNNNSFGWDNGLNARPGLTISGLAFGATPMLQGGGAYVFGSGAERTFELAVPAAGAPAVRDIRYNGDGTVAAGRQADRPLAAAAPEYHASTRAWGRIVPPLQGLPADRQADYDRFEKLHRAMVNPGDVENPPGLTGITAFQHLAVDLASWNDYGDLRWGGDQGPWSGNHYDWVYGLYLQFLRTGRPAFANLARVMARHEIDLDVYHTGNDGTAYTYQKNWETRPSHNSSDNGFGGGRPTHTWTQGYALHWLLTGDPRGRDAFEELTEGIRQYLYESFNGEARVDTNEIRTQGWLTENLVTAWRIDPDAVFATTEYGSKTLSATIKHVLQNVFDREAAAGTNGFVYAGDPNTPDPTTRHPLQNCYFIEPAAKAYEEVFLGRDPAYCAQLLPLIQRMTRFLMTITYGGDTNGEAMYRPRQIPEYMNTPTEREMGQLPYLLMAANAAGFCHLQGGGTDFLPYLRAAMQDFLRYSSIAGDEGQYVDPSLRIATAYNSNIYVDTESKVRGWSARYGAYALAAEAAALAAEDRTPPSVPAGLAAWALATNRVRLAWAPSTDTGGSGLAGYEVRRDGAAVATTAGADSTNAVPSPSASYAFRVAAFDGAGNTSDVSAAVSIAPATADADTNGLPDWWEQAYFFSVTGALAAADGDGDGANNRAEYRAGTVPTNGASRFVLTGVTPVGGDGRLALSWASVDGRNYGIVAGTNLGQGLDVTLTNPVAATPPVNVHTVRPPAGAAGFLRIETW